jgi:proteasome lid subunit RPN8/RPN11
MQERADASVELWEVTPWLQARMVEHARACYPREACGILAGHQHAVRRLYLARNVAVGNERYLLDPVEQRAIFLDIARHGWKLLAIYHSHPQREAVPSLTDLRLAAYPHAVMLIISLADWHCPDIRGYRIAGGQALEVSLGLEQG